MPVFIVLWIQALFSLLRAFFFNFFTRFWAFILFLAPVLIKKIFTWLGIGFVSYQGFDFILTRLQDWVFQRFNGIPTDVLQILLLAKLDVCIKLIFAAYSVAITIKVTTKSASLTRSTGNMEA